MAASTTPWWKGPVSQKYTPPVEPGEDIAAPFHSQVTALLPGTVTGITYGGYGARVDVGGVYYQHLDTVDVKKGQSVVAGQDIGLSGGQLFGGALPNSPLNSTGPHVEVGYVGGGDPSQLVARGPQSTAGDAAQQTQQAGGGGGFNWWNLFVSPKGNLNPSGQSAVPNLLSGPEAAVQAGITNAAHSAPQLVKDNIIPLVVAAVIIVVVLGTGQPQQQQSQPQLVPVPV